jgi:hypothetical protein
MILKNLAKVQIETLNTKNPKILKIALESICELDNDFFTEEDVIAIILSRIALENKVDMSNSKEFEKITEFGESLFKYINQIGKDKLKRKEENIDKILLAYEKYLEELKNT